MSLMNAGIFLFLIGACETNTSQVERSKDFTQANKLMQADNYARNHPDADYKAIPNSGYILPVEMSTIKNQEENVNAQFAFFDQAIPMGGIKLLDWENGMTWQKADQIYRDFIAKNKESQYINPFRENGSYEILVRLSLLADTSAKGLRTIHYYLEQLINGQSINTTLIYYCINKLKGYYSENDLKDLAGKAVRNFEGSKRLETGMTKLRQMESTYSRREQKDSGTREELRKAISNGESMLQQFNTDKDKLKIFASA